MTAEIAFISMSKYNKDIEMPLLMVIYLKQLSKLNLQVASTGRISHREIKEFHSDIFQLRTTTIIPVNGP